MKRFLFFTIACLSSIWGMAQIATDTYVEVLYFHGKQRCATCKAIDKHTKEVVNVDWRNWSKMVNYVSKK